MNWNLRNKAKVQNHPLLIYVLNLSWSFIHNFPSKIHNGPWNLVWLLNKISWTNGQVHQVCLQRWVDEKQKGNSLKCVVCPQCQTEYIIVFPNMGPMVNFLEIIDTLIKRLSPFLAAGVVVGSLYWTAVTYGAITILQVSVLNYTWSLSSALGYSRKHLMGFIGGWPQGRTIRDGELRSTCSLNWFASYSSWIGAGQDDPLGGCHFAVPSESPNSRQEISPSQFSSSN